jgi:hypothetical protein
MPGKGSKVIIPHNELSFDSVASFAKTSRLAYVCYARAISALF